MLLLNQGRNIKHKIGIFSNRILSRILQGGNLLPLNHPLSSIQIAVSRKKLN